MRLTSFPRQQIAVWPHRFCWGEARLFQHRVGSRAAGIATVGAASVEVAQEVLAETQTAILLLVPYFDTLRREFIAGALIGIAIAIHARIDNWKRGQQ